VRVFDCSAVTYSVAGKAINEIHLHLDPLALSKPQLQSTGAFPTHSLSSPISLNTQAAILFLLKNMPSCPLPANVATTAFSSPFPRNGTRNKVHLILSTSCEVTNSPRPLNSEYAEPPMTLTNVTRADHFHDGLSRGAGKEQVPRMSARVNLFWIRRGKRSFIPSVTGWGGC